LRQTSFPPENAPSFSQRSIVGTPRYSRSPSVDTGSLAGGATPSLVSATTNGKNRRGKKKNAGDEAAAVDDGKSANGGAASASGRGRPVKTVEDVEDEPDEDEDEDELLGDMVEERKRDEAAEQAEKEKLK
jgi:hypothetical protein